MSKLLVMTPMLLLTWVTSPSTHGALFLDTPLQPAYQATLNQQPQLAWQELTLALNQSQLDDHHWLPVKQEVLRQTNCGRALLGNLANKRHIRVSFVKRFGTTAKGYQVRISTENSANTVEVNLVAPDGTRLVSGRFEAEQGYQEFESVELLQKPRSGVFKLSLNEHTIELLVAIEDQSQWLTLNQQQPTPTVELSLPKTLKGCPNVAASWQWFDGDYRMLGHKVALQTNPQAIPTENPYSGTAKHLSASVEKIEYQQGIRIEYIQRMAIPFQ